jgi:quercetin dioxygenase-like cupin family protein
MQVASKGSMQVVHRDDIAGVSSVEVDGVGHELGEVRDFHQHAVLGSFVPDMARLSMSWVRLGPGEELAEHVHPTQSMILVTEGHGRVTGDATGSLVAGDVVVVPPGARHGFVGEPPSGMWGLSVQFEGAGLYENPDEPRVAFVADVDERRNGDGRMAMVRAENERHMSRYERECRLLVLMRNLAATTDANLSARVLAYLQPWSNAFQRVIALRAAFESDRRMRELSDEHLAEELGHHRLLADARASDTTGGWDPVIAAVSSWWVDQMMTAPSLHRTVLAHLVLEGSGMIFHQAAYPVLGDGQYFTIHAEGDEEHLEMGYRALAERSDWTVEEIKPVLREGWTMMTLLCDRIAECAKQS